MKGIWEKTVDGIIVKRYSVLEDKEGLGFANVFISKIYIVQHPSDRSEVPDPASHASSPNTSEKLVVSKKWTCSSSGLSEKAISDVERVDTCTVNTVTTGFMQFLHLKCG